MTAPPAIGAVTSKRWSLVMIEERRSPSSSPKISWCIAWEIRLIAVTTPPETRPITAAAKTRPSSVLRVKARRRPGARNMEKTPNRRSASFRNIIAPDGKYESVEKPLYTYCVNALARLRRRTRSRAFRVKLAARSNSARASLFRLSFCRRSPRMAGSRWYDCKEGSGSN
jgi:hypothetical protein